MLAGASPASRGRGDAGLRSTVPVKTGARLPVVMRGYDRAQVDLLLKRISQALNGGPPMSADEVCETCLL